MTVNRAKILEPLLHGYDAPDELTDHDRRLVRLAAAVIVHETDHRQAVLGDEAL